MSFCRDLLDKNIEEREGKTAAYDPACPPRLLKVRVCEWHKSCDHPVKKMFAVITPSPPTPNPAFSEESRLQRQRHSMPSQPPDCQKPRKYLNSVNFQEVGEPDHSQPSTRAVLNCCLRHNTACRNATMTR